MKENKALFIMTRLCVLILVGYMLASVLTYVVQNVLCEGMHMDNQFIRMVIGDDKVEEIKTNWSQGGEIVINWAERYPFDEQDVVVNEPVVQVQEQKIAFEKYKDRYLSLWRYLQDGLDQYTGSLNMFYEEMVTAGETYNRWIDWSYLSTQSTDVRTFLMKNGAYGYVTDKVSDEDMAEIVDSVVDFNEYLREQNISLLYVNPGNKICEEDDVVPAYISEYTNENQSALLSGLEAEGIDVIDLRKEMHEAGLNHADAFYITDAHWRVETALWAAGEIAGYANENFAFEFDLASFAEDKYVFTDYENAFMGSQGIALHLPEKDKEDFTTVYPKEQGMYNIKIPTRNLDMTGTFMDTLVMQDRVGVASRMYDSWRVRNDALVEIDNLQARNNQDKKILMLYDSFSWPLMSYLATDIAEIDGIHPLDFTGSIKDYIEKTQPDLVIMMYESTNVKPINWNAHTSAFDLR